MFVVHQVAQYVDGQPTKRSRCLRLRLGSLSGWVGGRARERHQSGSPEKGGEIGDVDMSSLSSWTLTKSGQRSSIS